MNIDFSSISQRLQPGVVLIGKGRILLKRVGDRLVRPDRAPRRSMNG